MAGEDLGDATLSNPLDKEFAEYAEGWKDARHKTTCWVCTALDKHELDVLNREFTAGRTVGMLCTWLTDRRGYSPEVATVAKLRHHFHARKHHLRPNKEAR